MAMSDLNKLTAKGGFQCFVAVEVDRSIAFFDSDQCTLKSSLQKLQIEWIEIASRFEKHGRLCSLASN